MNEPARDPDPVTSGRLNGWARRIAYAFIGLVAGNLAMAAWMLPWVLRARAELIRLHRPNPNAYLIGYLEQFELYAVCSFIGWLLVGLPVVLALPPRWLRRISWPVILLISACLGPAALSVVYLLLGRGRVYPQVFVGSSIFWQLALITSLVGYSVYCWLLRRRAPWDLN